MTLVEVMVAFSVLTVSVYLVSSTIASASMDRVTKRQMSIAAEAARSKIETMRAETFSQLFARYDADPSDDPGGPGTAPGPHFAIEGLSPVPGDPDGMPGEVLLPGMGPTLREDAVDPVHGLPRDLNGDILIDDQNHAGNYLVLPVGVRVEWLSPNGKRKVEMFTMLSAIKK